MELIEIKDLANTISKELTRLRALCSPLEEQLAVLCSVEQMKNTEILCRDGILGIRLEIKELKSKMNGDKFNDSDLQGQIEAFNMVIERKKKQKAEIQRAIRLKMKELN
jgi:FtsZ-binding cell division protein ZapB